MRAREPGTAEGVNRATTVVAPRDGFVHLVRDERQPVAVPPFRALAEGAGTTLGAEPAPSGRTVNQLVVHHEDMPLDLAGVVDLTQAHLSHAREAHSPHGPVRPGVVYVVAPRTPRPWLIPFASFDEWSLRDRFNEAVRVLTSLGAASVTSRAYGTPPDRTGLLAKAPGRRPLPAPLLTTSGFEFAHTGKRRRPKDPRPLGWPDEPGFAAAVENVLAGATGRIELTLPRHDTHSPDSELGVDLRSLGFELGPVAPPSQVSRVVVTASFPSTAKRVAAGAGRLLSRS